MRRFSVLWIGICLMVLAALPLAGCGGGGDDTDAPKAGHWDQMTWDQDNWR